MNHKTHSLVRFISWIFDYQTWNSILEDRLLVYDSHWLGYQLIKLLTLVLMEESYIPNVKECWFESNRILCINHGSHKKETYWLRSTIKVSQGMRKRPAQISFSVRPNHKSQLENRSRFLYTIRDIQHTWYDTYVNMRVC